jgi:RNA polymerase sigma-70 factor (ECF subfamily)
MQVFSAAAPKNGHMLADMQLEDQDVLLMLRYRDGDTEAFEALYARHKGPLYRYLLRHVRNAAAAADLFQEVWSRVVAKRATYEPRAKFATYLFHIAHNCAIDHHRRGRRAPYDTSVPAADAPSLEAELPEHLRPDRVAEYNQQHMAFLAALQSLPAEQREAFLLHEETGLGVEEIARMTCVGAETAKSRLRYALRKLQKSMFESLTPFEPRAGVGAARERAVGRVRTA